MKRLIEHPNIVVLALWVALVGGLALVQPATAGQYVQDEYDEASEPDEVYDSGTGWSQDGYASGDSGSLSASCSGTAHAWASIGGGSGSLSAYASVSSSAYAVKWWQWTGGGTPTGGTLEYNYTVSGGNSAGGWAYIGGSMSVSSAYSSGSSSADGIDGVTSVSAGSVSGGGEGLADAIVSPVEYATTLWTDEGEVGHYGAETAWYLYVSDDEEISAGTSFVGFSVSATCTTASADVSVASQTWGASASADGGCNASASGGADFP